MKKQKFLILIIALITIVAALNIKPIYKAAAGAVHYVVTDSETLVKEKLEQEGYSDKEINAVLNNVDTYTVSAMALSDNIELKINTEKSNYISTNWHIKSGNGYYERTGISNKTDNGKYEIYDICINY